MMGLEPASSGHPHPFNFVTHLPTSPQLLQLLEGSSFEYLTCFMWMVLIPAVQIPMDKIPTLQNPTVIIPL